MTRTPLPSPTARLRFAQIGPRWAQQLYDLNCDPAVIRYAGGDIPFVSVVQAREFAEAYSAYEDTGMGRWIVLYHPSAPSDQLKTQGAKQPDNGIFVGWCGLKIETHGLVDLGYRFLKKYWGLGIATEASRACLHHGFTTLNLPRIVAHAADENIASWKVLEKLGFTHVHTGDYDNLKNYRYYELNRDQYRP